MGTLTLTREQLHEAARILQDAPTAPHFMRQALCLYAAQGSLSHSDAVAVQRLARLSVAALPQHLGDHIRHGELETGTTETPFTPPANIAPSPAPKRRGRRPDGATAATPAERARRWRQAHAVRTVALPGDVADRLREEATRRELTRAALLAELMERHR